MRTANYLACYHAGWHAGYTGDTLRGTVPAYMIAANRDAVLDGYEAGAEAALIADLADAHDVKRDATDRAGGAL